MIAHNNRQKFESKVYRDTYLAGRVRTRIALQIRALREQRRLSQTDFAHRLRKPQSVVSRLENTEYGRVTVQTLLDIASALDIALIVKFCKFDDFFAQMSGISDQALSVESFSSDELESKSLSPLNDSLQACFQPSLSSALVLQMTERTGQPKMGSAPDLDKQEVPPILRAVTSRAMRNAA